MTLRTLSPAPAVALGLIFCPSEALAIALVGELRSASIETWRSGARNGIDACAIEHMDDRSLALVRSTGDLNQLGITIPDGTAVALLVQLELPAATTSAGAYEQIESALLPDATDSSLVRFCRLLQQYELLDRTELAAPGDTRRHHQLLKFRECVPTHVNQLVGAAKREVDGPPTLFHGRTMMSCGGRRRSWNSVGKSRVWAAARSPSTASAAIR